MRKLLIESRRRAWIVLLSAALVVGVAYAATGLVTRRFSAEAVMVVRANGPLASQPDASTQLASTYATVIPLDLRIQRAVEQVIADAHEGSFTTTNDPSTAVLRVVYKSRDRSSAIAGATAVAHAVSGPHPVSPTIVRGTVSIVRIPNEASGSTTTKGDILIAGGILGVLLGFVLLTFWRSHDPRIDSVQDLQREIDCPCFDLNAHTPATLEPLVEHLRRADAQLIVSVVPISSVERRIAERLHTSLAMSLGAARVRLVGAPGGREAGEAAAVGSDVLLLVAVPGTRTVALHGAIDLLARYHMHPTIAVLMRAPRWRKAIEMPPGGDAEQTSAQTARSVA